MDLKTLKTKHPEAYQAALAEGEAKEFDRVSAHLMCGQKFDAMPIALQAISEHAGFTAELQTQYIDHATGQLERRARQLDSDEAGAVLDGAKKATAQSVDNGDLVAAAMGLKTPSGQGTVTDANAALRATPSKQLDNGDRVALAMAGVW